MATVKVKLGQRSLVNGETREAGSVVEVDERIAEHFGTIIGGPADTADEKKADNKDSKK